MSEDADFKILLKDKKLFSSKTLFLKELKRFKADISANLGLADLVFGEIMSRNEGQYSRIEINYPSCFSVHNALRPHILLEFTVSECYLPIEKLKVNTLIEDTLENIFLFESPKIPCVSISETAIEKWVGLTRRISAIERGYHDDDNTLIRHVYDLHAIKQAGGINDNFFNLAKNIILNDADQFKNQHPEYTANPLLEIKNSMDLLKTKAMWQDRYQEFIEAMVYDHTDTLSYKTALDVLDDMSDKIIYLLSESQFT